MSTSIPSECSGYDAKLRLIAADPQELIGNIKRLLTENRKTPAEETEDMLAAGRALCILKAAVPYGKFIPFVEVDIGLKRNFAWRMMRAARVFDSAAGTVNAAGSKTKLFELISLDEEQIEELELTGRTGGLAVSAIAEMSVMELRAAVREELAEKRRSEALLSDKEFSGVFENSLPAGVADVHQYDRGVQERASTHVLPADEPCASKASTSSHLNPSDRIKSLYAGRPGTVVKVYPDGSACILWDDGEPQAEGLGHERIPHELLVRTADPSPAPAPASAPAPDVSKVVNFALAARKAYSPPRGHDPHQAASIEKRKAYCAELLQTMLHYADEADLGELEQALEEQVTEISSQRHVPGLIAARYELFCRFWVAGGAK